MIGPDYVVQYSTNLMNWSMVFEKPIRRRCPSSGVDKNASLTNPASYYRVLLVVFPLP